jgi:hypothetical protein
MRKSRPKTNGNTKTGIYKITFPNGHYYIGQAVDLNRRYRNHLLDLKKNKHANKRLQYCWDKYGEFSFEILEECNYDKLDDIENKYLRENVENDNCCNMCSQGRSRKGIKASKKTKELISNYNRLVGKCKPVYMFSRDHMDMLARFDTISDAQRIIGCGPKDISKSCKTNGRYNVKGYKFLYASGVDSFLDHVIQVVPFN